MKRIGWALGMMLVLGWGAQAYAQQISCDNTTPAYTNEFKRGVELNTAGKYDEALELFEAFAAACPEDPAPLYGVGVVLESKGECATALKVFKESLALWKAGADKADAAGVVYRPTFAEDKINDRLLDSLDTCVPRTLYTINCVDEQVKVSIDGGELQSCPTEGELAEGTHEVVPTRDGYLPGDPVKMNLKKGERVQVNIPALQPIPKDEGVLVLTCPPGITSVELEPEGGEGEGVPCPSEHVLKPGRYRLLLEGSSEGQVAMVEQGKTTQLLIQEVAVGGPADKIGLFITLRGGAGHAFVGERRLYSSNFDDQGRNSGDAIAPTLVAGSLINEIGYYINDYVGVGGRARFNFPEFAFAGGAFVRAIPWRNEHVGIHADLAVGGGSANIAFQFDSNGTGNCEGDKVCLVQIGTVFAGLSLGLDVRLSELFSLVIVAEGTYFFYSADEGTVDPTAILLDYTAGIEVAF